MVLEWLLFLLFMVALSKESLPMAPVCTPCSALLEVQPLLLDVARGAAAPPSSSSSSDDDKAEALSALGVAGTAYGADASTAPDSPALAPAAETAVRPEGANQTTPLAVDPAVAQHVEVEVTQSPSGACARVLLRVAAAAAADCTGAAPLAAAAAQRLAAAVRQQFGGGGLALVSSVRCWCKRGAMDAQEWGEALRDALGALSGVSRGRVQHSVQSIPVSSVWVGSSSGGNCGSGTSEEQECCFVVELLVSL